MLVGLLLHALLDHPCPGHGFDQVCGKAAAVFRHFGPGALRDAFKAPGGEEQQRDDARQTEEKQRRNQPQHHRRDTAAQKCAQQFRRPLNQQRFEAVDVPVGARNDAPGLGPVEVANAQGLNVAEHPDAQLIKDADGRAASDVLRDPGQYKACAPGHEKANPEHGD